MKDSWIYKSLNEIAVNLDSKRVPITKGVRSAGDIPYYGASGIVDYVKDYIFDEDLLLISEDGANLLARTYPIAFPITGKTWVNNHAHVLRFPNKVTQKFVEYFLNSIPLNNFVSGMAQPKLNQSMLNKIQIPSPPLAIQNEIVEKLDAAFAEIDKAISVARQNAENSKSLFQSYLKDVFEKRGEGWDEKLLGSIAEVSSGGTPSISKKEYWEGEIAWYSSGELNEQYTSEPQRKITDAGLKNSNAKLFPAGSLMVGMYDTAAMKMSLLNRDGTFNQAVAGVKPNSKIDMEFIFYALNYTKPYVLTLRTGVRQRNLSLAKIKNIAVRVPDLSTQIEITKKLNECKLLADNLNNIFIQKVNGYQSLKKSILTQAFNGELTKA